MKFKTAILAMALATTMSAFCGCASSSNTKITQDEAIDIGKDELESALKQGDVVNAALLQSDSFVDVEYGNIDYSYLSDNEQHKITIDGTCWGYDSNGNLQGKYKFDDAKMWIVDDNGVVVGGVLNLLLYPVE